MSLYRGNEEVANFWDLKPWWCQPWSILSTGLLFISISWWGTKILWLTALISIGVIGWWALFLVLAPAVYRQQINQQGSGLDQNTT